LVGEIREVRDTMGVRIEDTIAGVRRVRESSGIGGFDGGRAMRSKCPLRVCTCTLRICACTLRVCTCLRRRKFVDPVERISKRQSVVSRRPRRTPRDHARELAFPKNMFNSLSPLATGAAPFGKYRSKRVWSSVSEDATTQEPHSVISGGQHGGSLLVVELGDP